MQHAAPVGYEHYLDCLTNVNLRGEFNWRSASLATANVTKQIPVRDQSHVLSLILSGGYIVSRGVEEAKMHTKNV
jgi:hypothetical protein